MKHDGFDPVSNTSPWTSFLRLLAHPTRVEVFCKVKTGWSEMFEIMFRVKMVRGVRDGVYYDEALPLRKR